MHHHLPGDYAHAEQGGCPFLPSSPPPRAFYSGCPGPRSVPTGPCCFPLRPAVCRLQFSALLFPPNFSGLPPPAILSSLFCGRRIFLSLLFLLPIRVVRSFFSCGARLLFLSRTGQAVLLLTPTWHRGAPPLNIFFG